MSLNYPGGFITKSPPSLNPALGNSAPGMWTLDQAMQAVKSGNWPAYDPYFENTTLLLHGNGTNGAQNNTFLDSSTNNFSITRNGNTTQGTFSPFSQTGWSNYFDGTGDYLTVADNAAFNLAAGDWTIEAWICPATLPSSGSISVVASQYIAAGERSFLFAIYNNSGTIQLLIQPVSDTTQTAISQTCTFNIGEWVHIAAVRSGNNITLYRNGVSLGTTAYSSTINDATGPYLIGCRYNASSVAELLFTGYISNHRLVKGTAVYTSNFTPPTAPLTAITNTSLLTCQSNRFVDNSSNAFAITVNGDVSVQAFSPFNPTAAWSASTNGGSGYFDGTGDYLTVANNSAIDVGTGVFTYECWFYPTASKSQQLIAANGTGSGGHLALYSNYIALGRNNVAEDLTTAAGTIVIGQWNHIVAVRNSSNNTAIFINGTRQAYSASNTNNYGLGGYALGIGIGEADAGYVAQGYMAGAAVYKSAQYDPTQTTLTVPTAPSTGSGSGFLCNFTNAGITDATAKNDLETVGNAQISTTQSKFGGSSMYFDGTGDYLKAPNSPNYNFGSGNFTIEFWMYTADVTPATAAWFVALFQTSSGQNSWGVRLETDGTLNAYLSSDGGESPTTIGAASPGLSDSTWHHIAVVRNGSGANNIAVYVDGTSKATGTFSSALFNSNLPLTVGIQNNTSFSQYFNGYIDDLRITKGVARYTANFTPQTSQWQDQ